MDFNFNRRDFLKLAGSISLGALSSPLVRAIHAEQLNNTKKKNVIIVVFDAFSARNMSLYGYGRETTPNLARLAERAIVYHNHYAGGNFTTPGTASLLTGTLAWNHRAFGFFRTVSDTLIDKSIFHAFNDYYRIAYSHNPLVEILLNQFASGLDENIPVEQFLLTNDLIIQSLFSKDKDISSVAWERIIKKEGGYSYSLFLSNLYKWRQGNLLQSLGAQFPRGLPSIRSDNYYTLEMFMDWLKTQSQVFPKPFMGYFHLLPPHYPYKTQAEFYNRFLNDRFSPSAKPEDVFTEEKSADFSSGRRQQYDEFILYLDREFGKFFDHLESTGVLDDTWVILTSDHGELFERGIVGHVTPVLYEPVVHIPLMIFEPGRTTRLDVHSRTSAVDLLPTLLHVTGGSPPSWTDGVVMPPFSENGGNKRNVYVLQAKNTGQDEPLEQFTASAFKDNYKLHYFVGYEELGGQERIELYDLEQDPEELNNIYTPDLVVGKRMLEELRSIISKANMPYQ